MAAATEQLPKGGKLLIDLQRYSVQGGWIADRMRVLLLGAGARIDRLAIVGSDSALQRLQVRRALAPSNLRFFNAEDVAVAWLLGGRDHASSGTSQ